ncbi:MAG: DUF6646 family protein [Prevotella denticola]
MENSFRHGSLFLWFAMVICLLCVPRSVYAQAWDGDGDIKVYAGYANVGGKSGFEAGSDYAISDFVSLGGQITVIPLKDRDDDDYGALDGYDFSLHGDYHWAEVMKLPSVMDIYTGASVGLRTGGLQAGVRYNFSETFGLYAQVRQNLFKTFGENSDHAPVYKGKTALSVGLTLTF